jgi:hypothetical protein
MNEEDEEINILILGKLFDLHIKFFKESDEIKESNTIAENKTVKTPKIVIRLIYVYYHSRII